MRFALRKEHVIIALSTTPYRIKNIQHFFDNSIYDIINAPKECINSDDLYISFYLARKNIARYTFKSKYLRVRDITVIDLGTKSDALHRLFPNEAERHRSCVAFLHRKYPGVEF